MFRFFETQSFVWMGFVILAARPLAGRRQDLDRWAGCRRGHAGQPAKFAMILVACETA